ncbi:MAG: TIGR00730 family Rossman fold protein [Minisyncoccia bacterium]
MIDKNSKLAKIKNVCSSLHDGDITDSRLCLVEYELRQGFKLMNKHPKSVTIFGSARLPEDNPHSQNATELARRLSENGYTIATGGGHGIMGAGNKGAHIAGGPSIGMNIELPFEQTVNEYVTESIDFHHFFPRKVALSYSSEAYIYFAGGFGTLDELFELLTLKQTGKIPQIPIILFGSEFWQPLEEFFKQVFLRPGHETISEKDLDLYVITDDIDEAVNIVTDAPVRAEVSSRYDDIA